MGIYFMTMIMRKHSVGLILFRVLATAASPIVAQALVLNNIGAVTPLAWGDYDHDGGDDLLQYNGSSLPIPKNNFIEAFGILVAAGIDLLKIHPPIGYVGNKKNTENSSC